VALRIHELRESLGMRQTVFADALGTRPSTVSKWEVGKNRPSPDVLVRIARLADGAAKLFFLEEAGIPPQYFEGTPMLGEIRQSRIPELETAALVYGLYSRVAKKLGVSPQHVRHVAKGLSKSKRVAAAIEREVQRIRRKGPERAA
jgi:transcriptional regulator with XRE-family HTH domain